MRRSVAVVLVGCAALAVTTPAQAASTKNLYMVKGVDMANGVYYGDFAALAKTGTQVVGAVGAFNSEYICIKGTVKNGKLTAKVYENGQPVQSFTRKWVGTGSTARIKGMKRVPASEVITYLEGTHPKLFIADCRAATGG